MNITLPEPDAAARAHSEKVAAHVCRLIDINGGWLSLHDYMQAVLYAPGLGYYMAGTQKFGSDGDFITASELTPLYAQAWAAPIGAALIQSHTTLPAGGGGCPDTNPRPPSAATPFEKGAMAGEGEGRTFTPSPP
ncbi:MAG: hypothetical protein LBE75_05365 [Burkholderiales bacterium]|jgi:hypothetical protein|nr:hypothetical protein [Burkholderiales bacterium]